MHCSGAATSMENCSEERPCSRPYRACSTSSPRRAFSFARFSSTVFCERVSAAVQAARRRTSMFSRATTACCRLISDMRAICPKHRGHNEGCWWQCCAALRTSLSLCSRSPITMSYMERRKSSDSTCPSAPAMSADGCTRRRCMRDNAPSTLWTRGRTPPRAAAPGAANPPCSPIACEHRPTHAVRTHSNARAATRGRTPLRRWQCDQDGTGTQAACTRRGSLPYLPAWQSPAQRKQAT